MKAPFGKLSAVKAYTFKKWVEGEDKGYDLALIILDQSAGRETGWNGMLAFKNNIANNIKAKSFHITGYPGDFHATGKDEDKDLKHNGNCV